MNPDCGYSQDILGGSELVDNALFGGVVSACTTGFPGDEDANGYPDVFDGCMMLPGMGDEDQQLQHLWVYESWF